MRRWAVCVCLIVATVVLPSLPVAAAARWTPLRSPNFTLEGNVPERELRAVARRLDQFREVLGRPAVGRSGAGS